MEENRIMKLERANQRLTKRLRTKTKEDKQFKEDLIHDLRALQGELLSARKFSKLLTLVVLLAIAAHFIKL